MFYKHLISYKKDRITIQELAKVINEGIDLFYLIFVQSKKGPGSVFRPAAISE